MTSFITSCGRRLFERLNGRPCVSTCNVFGHHQCPQSGCLLTVSLVSPWSPWSPQVMKRVRTEQIQHAVAQYLKRRQYVDAESPLKGANLFQTPEEMAANLSGKEGRGVRFPGYLNL